MWAEACLDFRLEFNSKALVSQTFHPVFRSSVFRLEYGKFLMNCQDERSKVYCTGNQGSQGEGNRGHRDG
jgi:hypothetical protein